MTLRAGLKYQPGATEDDYLIPSSNDVDLVVPSLGIGYRVGKSLELDRMMVAAGVRWGP